jgi:WD40 repeat protein
MVVGAGVDLLVYRWDAATGERIGDPMRSHTNSVQAIAIAAPTVGDAGALIVSGDDHDAWRRWDAATGERLEGVLTGETKGVQADRIATFTTADGDRVAACMNRGGEVRLWDLDNNRMAGLDFRVRIDDPFEMFSLASLVVGGADMDDSSAGGRRLLIAAGENSTDESENIVVWDAATGERADTHPLTGISVAATQDADGTALVATASRTGTIVIRGVRDAI